MTLRHAATVFFFLALACGPILSSRAEAAEEFSHTFYNAYKCMQVQEVNNNGVREILARNNCQARVAALVCYRIIASTGVYSELGWYCDYSNLYNPGVTRAISRDGRYYPKLKFTACAATNQRCDQVLRSTSLRVGDSRGDPEGAARSIRTGS